MPQGYIKETKSYKFRIAHLRSSYQASEIHNKNETKDEWEEEGEDEENIIEEGEEQKQEDYEGK